MYQQVRKEMENANISQTARPRNSLIIILSNQAPPLQKRGRKKESKKTTSLSSPHKTGSGI